jgi:hypothetical protein
MPFVAIATPSIGVTPGSEQWRHAPGRWHWTPNGAGILQRAPFLWRIGATLLMR